MTFSPAHAYGDSCPGLEQCIERAVDPVVAALVGADHVSSAIIAFFIEDADGVAIIAEMILPGAQTHEFAVNGIEDAFCRDCVVVDDACPWWGDLPGLPGTVENLRRDSLEVEKPCMRESKPWLDVEHVMKFRCQYFPNSASTDAKCSAVTSGT